MLNNLPSNDPGLKVTPQALNHIQGVLAQVEGEKPMGIRIGVKKAGCSGYEYILEYVYAAQQKPFDFDFDFENIKILVDKEVYLKFLKGGTLLDFEQAGLKSGLKFENPNVAHQCGCGESFTLVDEA